MSNQQNDIILENKKEIEEETVNCEKCGEETGVKMIGDESYDYCDDCGWVTH